MLQGEILGFKKRLVAEKCADSEAGRFLCLNRKETLSLEKLEAQLKACLCRISFSKAKVGILTKDLVCSSERRSDPVSLVCPPLQPSVLALAVLRQEMESIRSKDMLEIAFHIQRHLKVRLLINGASREGIGVLLPNKKHEWVKIK